MTEFTYEAQSPSSSAPQGSDDLYMPELYLAGGYEYMFHDNIGIKLGAEVGTVLVSWRVSGGGGLVFRF